MAKYPGFSQDFVNQVQNIKLLFDLGCITICKWSEGNLAAFLLTKPVMQFSYKDLSLIKIGNKPDAIEYDVQYDLSEMLEDIVNHKNRNEVISEFVKFLMIPLMVKLYEAFKDDNGRFKIVENESWFIFLRNLRLVSAHGIDMIWDEIKDYGTGQVFYDRKGDGKKIILDKSLKGQEFNLEQIGGFFTLIDLASYVYDFARQQLQNNTSI